MILNLYPSPLERLVYKLKVVAHTLFVFKKVSLYHTNITSLLEADTCRTMCTYPRAFLRFRICLSVGFTNP